MNIVHYPHPALRHPAVPLTAIDKKVHLMVGGMLELMYAARGLGLAAPQVALPYQLFVMNSKADPQQPVLERVLINPAIIERKGTIEGEEGCLSFPELFVKVRRAKRVRVQAYNLQGEAVEIVPDDDLESRILQHEFDHLRGELFIDKCGPLAKLAARGSLREFERRYRKAQEKGDIPPDADIVQTLKQLELEA